MKKVTILLMLTLISAGIINAQKNQRYYLKVGL